MNGPAKFKGIANFQSADMTWQKNDEDKGKVFLAHFLAQIGQKDMSTYADVKGAISEMCKSHTIGEEAVVTSEDIHATLKRSKNTAPGPDGIRYGDIAKLTDAEIDELTQVFNTSIESGHVNEDWLHSYLIPLPKPGKDKKKIQGYRIITMQNTIGKLLEKIIAKKVSCHLERLHLLPPTLGGYRPNRETWANAAVFAQDVFEGFQSGTETCAAAIDLEDAYNRVPLDFLIHRLMELQLSPFLINWIASNLLQRRVVLKCGSWASQPSTINPGLPQGSPLSPVLFNVYTLSITGDCKIQGGRTLSYADDILVYSQGRDR